MTVIYRYSFMSIPSLSIRNFNIMGVSFANVSITCVKVGFKCISRNIKLQKNVNFFFKILNKLCPYSVFSSMFSVLALISISQPNNATESNFRSVDALGVDQAIG